MANITITPQKLNKYGSSLTVSKTAMVADSSLQFDVNGLNDERTQIYLEVTAGQADFTVQSGSYEDAAIGDLALASVITGVTKVLSLSSSRFKDASDDIVIDVNSSSLTGNAYAVSFPLSK